MAVLQTAAFPFRHVDMMERPEGVEPPTAWFEAKNSFR